MPAEKRAYLVLGAESSGTRFMRAILKSAGCLCETEGLWQQWDDAPPVDQTPIVWHQSYPHGNRWPDLRELVAPLGTYSLRAVVMVRDWYCVSQSQRGWHNEAVIRQNLRRAYPLILNDLCALSIPFWMVTYESLVLNYEPLARWLLRELELPDDRPLPRLVDGNTKWYVVP